MKIKKLVMSGFGPYATKQEVDFEEHLADKNMFVITGNTGAGKTTLFDAINFALYGEASGSDREGKSLRSDFADATTPTEVELWFSLRNKDYYIKRSPQYFRAKQKGTGETESKPTAELKLSDQKTLTGPKEVTKEVERIIGINSEQFKQLVMIPQGEFKKLLTSDSDKKEDIFRKIFGTKIFSDIQQRTKDQASTLRKNIEQVQRDRENRIRAFQCEGYEALEALVAAKDLRIDLLLEGFKEALKGDETKQKEVNEQILKVEEILSQTAKEIALVEANNKKLEHLEKYKQQLDTLKEQRSAFEQKEKMLENAKKAITAAQYEQRYEERNQEVKKLTAQLSQIQGQLESYKQDFEKVSEAFKLEVAREQEKNDLIRRIDSTNKLKEKVAEYEANQKKVDLLAKEVELLEKRLSEIGSSLKVNGEKLIGINESLEAIYTAKEQRAQLILRQTKEESQKQELLRLEEAVLDWAKNKERHTKGTSVYEAKDKEYQEAKGRYEALEETLRRSQAGLLAKNLQKGEACPVCGSLEHPVPATLENVAISEEAVKKAKADLEEIAEERQKYLEGLTKIYNHMQSLEGLTIHPLAKTLLGVDSEEEITVTREKVKEALVNEEIVLKDLTTSIQTLEQQIAKETVLTTEKVALEKNNVQLSQETEEKHQILVIKQGEFKGAESTLEGVKAAFEGNLKTLEELNALERDQNAKLAQLRKAYSEAEERFKISKSLLDKTEGNQVALQETLAGASEVLEEALSAFKTKVLELGFEDYKTYTEAKMTEEQMIQLEKGIHDFKMNLSNAKQLYDVALKEAEGLVKVDLTVLEEKWQSQKQTKENFEKEGKEIFSRMNHNKSILEDSKKLSKAIETDEKEYQVIGKLAKVVNGENTKKISFERYVLAAYFEDIIAAANLRFTKMTMNRYELSRKESVGDKRKGQGLDLEVFDHYTGKKRDVKTLSGGESFKASLAMALGLADVVQAYAGGIQLDTMFIDEGFGTLDPESLDNAIDCLVDLQNDGRIVGVISHVQELKDRIDTRLEVTATQKGSQVVFKH